MDSTLKRLISFITVLIIALGLSLTAAAAENSPAGGDTQKAVKKAALEKKQPQAKQAAQAGKAQAKKSPEPVKTAFPDSGFSLRSEKGTNG